MNLYLECGMGASGDMLIAALADLLEDKQALAAQLNALQLPGAVFSFSEKITGGIRALKAEVCFNGKEETPEHYEADQHHGRSLSEVLEIIDVAKAPDKVKADAGAVYTLIAEAEAAVHGSTPGEVHFHELGMLDAIADVTAVAYLMNLLSPQRVTVSPVNLGGGTVHCAHGILPVPAPATAQLLQGVPCYKSDIQSELCTPTGAALLTYYADAFSDAVSFGSAVKTGIGAGYKEFEAAPNILRAYRYEGGVIELSCNVDDMTGEEIAFAAQVLLDAGARDAFVTPALMKKGRPAYLLTVLCDDADRERFIRLIFRHTATIGLREYAPSRYTLQREIREEAGVRIKRSEGWGTVREKPEFEDIKALALQEGISLFEARERLK